MSIVTSCYYIHNTESCSTGLPSIYRCSTGLGVEFSRAAVLSSRVDTRYGGGGPASRACLRFFCGKCERFPHPYSPSNPLDARINSSPNSYFAPECPVRSLPIIWDQHPQESPRRCVSDSGAIQRVSGAVWWRMLAVGVRRTPDTVRSGAVAAPHPCVRF